MKYKLLSNYLLLAQKTKASMEKALQAFTTIAQEEVRGMAELWEEKREKGNGMKKEWGKRNVKRDEKGKDKTEERIKRNGVE